jgi:hypothetical protein
MMVGAIPILAAEDGISDIIFVAVLLVMSAIGAIASKIKDRKAGDKKKPEAPQRRIPPRRGARGRAEGTSVPPPRPHEAPRPVARRPTGAPAPRPEAVARPMPPRVPGVPDVAARQEYLRRQAEAVRRAQERAAEAERTTAQYLQETRARFAVPSAKAEPARRRVGRFRLNRATLREGIVLREVLGPPIALRDRQSEPLY